MLSPSLTGTHGRRHPDAHTIRSRNCTYGLIWCLTILCTIITVALILGAILVFIGYLVIKPKVPFVSVSSAHLDLFDFDRARGYLTTQLTILIIAGNDNTAHASFSDFRYVLSFHGMEIAELHADPFDLSKNSSTNLNYVVPATSIPLDPGLMRIADFSVKQKSIIFDIKGHAKVMWRIGPITSVKSWCNLDCQLVFKTIGNYSSRAGCTSSSE